MILLDANVVSALMSPSPPRQVLDWINREDSETLFLSAVTVAEIGYGIELLPDGRRRHDLAERFEAFVAEGFDRRVVPFDSPSAVAYGRIMSRRQRIGRPLQTLDGQIAATAAAYRLSVATRNVREFEECGLDLIDPFGPGV